MRIATTVLLVGLCSAAEAAFVDGNILHEACKARENSVNDHEFVNGYVTGVVDYSYSKATRSKSAASFCFPQGAVKSGQVRDLVCKYLGDHPQHRHLPAGFLVEQALTTVWPCNH